MLVFGGLTYTISYSEGSQSYEPADFQFKFVYICVTLLKLHERVLSDDAFYGHHEEFNLYLQAGKPAWNHGESALELHTSLPDFH